MVLPVEAVKGGEVLVGRGGWKESDVVPLPAAPFGSPATPLTRRRKSGATERQPAGGAGLGEVGLRRERRPKRTTTVRWKRTRMKRSCPAGHVAMDRTWEQGREPLGGGLCGEEEGEERAVPPRRLPPEAGVGAVLEEGAGPLEAATCNERQFGNLVSGLCSSFPGVVPFPSTTTVSWWQWPLAPTTICPQF